jgi:hypothetical protein
VLFCNTVHSEAILATGLLTQRGTGRARRPNTSPDCRACIPERSIRCHPRTHGQASGIGRVEPKLRRLLLCPLSYGAARSQAQKDSFRISPQGVVKPAYGITVFGQEFGNERDARLAQLRPASRLQTRCGHGPRAPLSATAIGRLQIV